MRQFIFKIDRKGRSHVQDRISFFFIIMGYVAVLSNRCLGYWREVSYSRTQNLY